MKGDGLEPEDINFVFDFKYLGFLFQSDGNNWRHVEIRMTMAGSQFGKLRHIWWKIIIPFHSILEWIGVSNTGKNH